MMRLTETRRAGRLVTLRVEGSIARDDATLLLAECNSLLDLDCVVQLDLAGVSLVDAGGAATLRHLRLRQLEIVNCPPFILDFVDGGAPK